MGTYLILSTIITMATLCPCLGTKVEYDKKAVIINGQRKLILSGSIHYPRSTQEMWPDLIQKAKEGGLDAVETYIFWNAHEPLPRQYNFRDNLDFVRFFKEIERVGLYGILRIGPYTCAEWNYGGLPVWLHNIQGIKMRTDNEIFKREMQAFTYKIIDMAKKAKLFASQGGPIILAQIENEYGNVMGPYGDEGKRYLEWCAQMAVASNIGVPWIMCQQSDAPSSMINACNGFYCDHFTPSNPENPKMWTENWTGWFKKWGEMDPHRPAEDVAYSVARFYQNGGVLQNYYMYHGGTNFGRTSGGPFVVTSYDYDAPLDEYGNLNEPKWGHLKNLHAAIKTGEKTLTSYTDVSTTNITDGIMLTKYINNGTGESFCYLSNTKKEDGNVVLEHSGRFSVPAWSVSILKDCSKEIYNTAKVTAQTTVYAKKTHPEDEASRLTWQWKPEEIEDTLNGIGAFKTHQLLDQKTASSDTSDHLWYMTSFRYDGDTKTNMTLRANYSGHILHAYVNSELIGYQWNSSFVFERPVTVKPGNNIIALLSSTVGLQNYGAFFDEKPNGLSGGPVELINGDSVINLTKNLWTYKVGMNGEKRRFFMPLSSMATGWYNHGASYNTTAMTWMKADFKAPAGSDPVVVDLMGMGKGEAWVNGRSIGRYWPTRVADGNTCNGCDYRGSYSEKKCVTNCGNPTQRWYHVPRSFLRKGRNQIVLYEEFGGNPDHVAFQVVSVEKVCGSAVEEGKVELSCPLGRVISKMEFASYDTPQGPCDAFERASVVAPRGMTGVSDSCLGKQNCSVSVSKEMLGAYTQSESQSTRLAVQAYC